MKKWFFLWVVSASTYADDPFASFDDVVVESSQSSVGLTGYAQSSMQYLSRGSEWGSLRQRLWLEPYYRPQNEWFSLESAFSIDWDPAIGARKDAKEWDTEVRKLYGSIVQSGRTITIGKQMMIWGSGSALSQGAYFNAMDSSDPLASGLAINSVATPAIRWREFLGDDVLDLIVTATPSVNELAMSGSIWDQSTPAVRAAFERESLDEPVEIGVGYQTNRTGYDLFFGMAYVYQDDPAVVQERQSVILERDKSASAFMQYNVNSWGGVAQLQARYDHKVRFTNDQHITASKEQWSILGGWSGYIKETSVEIDVLFSRKTRGGVTPQLSQNYHYEFTHYDWTIDVGGVYNFDDHSSLFEFKLSYKPNDRMEYVLGYNGFYGHAQSDYGAFKANSMAFLRLNIYF
ncbi:hypothetical protein [Vibrio caribbeanicus]|uniref:hypothetical protein n=1 Tax=Vibrio caribbeanicus TaxID=701175 RepID=UPI0030DA1450